MKLRLITDISPKTIEMDLDRLGTLAENLMAAMSIADELRDEPLSEMLQVALFRTGQLIAELDSIDPTVKH